MNLELKTESVEIDGTKYETRQFAAMRSLLLLARLAKAIGPAMALMQTAPDASGDLAAIAGALSELNPNEVESLVLDILADTAAYVKGANGSQRVEFGSQGNIDRVFSGKLGTLFKVLGHAIRVNYSDFGPGSAPPAPPTSPTTE